MFQIINEKTREFSAIENIIANLEASGDARFHTWSYRKKIMDVSGDKNRTLANQLRHLNDNDHDYIQQVLILAEYAYRITHP